MSKKAPHQRAEHALFPIPADAADLDLSERDISWIYIYRNGEQAPVKFAAAELEDEDDIAKKFGGGRYTLKARDEKKARWTAHRELQLAGPSLPLFDANMAPASPPPVQVAALAPAAPQLEGSSPLVRDAIAIGAAFSPLIIALVNGSAQRAQAQNELLIRVLAENKSSGGNSDIMPLLAAMVNNQMNRNPAAEVAQYMQLGAQFAGQGGGADGDDIGSTIAQAVEGINAMNEAKRLKLEEQRAAAQQPPAPPAAGSK